MGGVLGGGDPHFERTVAQGVWRAGRVGVGVPLHARLREREPALVLRGWRREVMPKCRPQRLVDRPVFCAFAGPA